MEVIFLLLGISFLMALLFLVIFIINIRNGQYEDTYTPSVRILFDDHNKQTGKQKPKKLKKR